MTGQWLVYVFSFWFEFSLPNIFLVKSSLILQEIYFLIENMQKLITFSTNCKVFIIIY